MNIELFFIYREIEIIFCLPNNPGHIPLTKTNMLSSIWKKLGRIPFQKKYGRLWLPSNLRWSSTRKEKLESSSIYKKKLRLSSIYKKVKDVFHLQKKIRSYPIYKKINVVFLLTKYWVIFHCKLSGNHLKALVYI